MATKIRLKRLGKIREPHYRIVVIDSRAKRDGRAIEEIGQYHPKNDPSVIQVDSERVQYWLGVGAQPTEAVVAILKRTGDWQQFSGDKTPSGVTPQADKADKLTRFNAALAEADDAPKSDAITTRKAKAEAEGDEAAETSEATQTEAPQTEDTETEAAPTEDDQAPKPADEPAEAPAEGAADESTEA